MTKDEFRKQVTDLLEDFTAEEEVWGDDAQLCVNPSSLKAMLSVEVDDSLESDCFDVMEFLRPSAIDPSRWELEPEAVDALVSEYFPL